MVDGVSGREKLVDDDVQSFGNRNVGEEAFNVETDHEGGVGVRARTDFISEGENVGDGVGGNGEGERSGTRNLARQ